MKKKATEFATLLSKGQMTIPMVIRKALKLKKGDKVNFKAYRDGRIEVSKQERN